MPIIPIVIGVIKVADMAITAYDVYSAAQSGGALGAAEAVAENVKYNVVPGGKIVSRIAKNVHGNSAASTKAQHMYMIQDSEGNIKKIGISGQPLNKNGTSPRANRQLQEGDTATVLESGIPGRATALEKEAQTVEGLKNYGERLPDQKRPQI